MHQYSPFDLGKIVLFGWLVPYAYVGLCSSTVVLVSLALGQPKLCKYFLNERKYAVRKFKLMHLCRPSTSAALKCPIHFFDRERCSTNQPQQVCVHYGTYRRAQHVQLQWCTWVWKLDAMFAAHNHVPVVLRRYAATLPVANFGNTSITSDIFITLNQ